MAGYYKNPGLRGHRAARREVGRARHRGHPAPARPRRDARRGAGLRQGTARQRGSPQAARGVGGLAPLQGRQGLEARDQVAPAPGISASPGWTAIAAQPRWWSSTCSGGSCSCSRSYTMYGGAGSTRLTMTTRSGVTAGASGAPAWPPARPLGPTRTRSVPRSTPRRAAARRNARSGLGLDPPRDVCRRVLSRLYPQAPGEVADADPWTSLLWTGGRTELPGRPESRWRPHPAPLTS